MLLLLWDQKAFVIYHFRTESKLLIQFATCTTLTKPNRLKKTKSEIHGHGLESRKVNYLVSLKRTESGETYDKNGYFESSDISVNYLRDFPAKFSPPVLFIGQVRIFDSPNYHQRQEIEEEGPAVPSQCFFFCFC